ncbi:hypothetical protein ACIF2S_07130 [Pseudomonas taetrolens]
MTSRRFQGLRAEWPEQLAPGSRQRVYVSEHRACGGVRKALFTLTDEEA